MKSKYKTSDEEYDKSERLKQQKYYYEEQCRTIKNIAENGSYAFALDRALMEDDRYSSLNTVAGAPLATDAIFTLARYYTDAYHNAKEELIHDILYKSYRAYISLGLEPYRDDQLVDNLISKIDQSDEKYVEIIAFAKSKFLEMRQNLTYLIKHYKAFTR
ncbi:MAG: hypothetical protein H2069_02455 [Legionella sp.]|nr:hypothetical protein [Legionella sp.]